MKRHFGFTWVLGVWSSLWARKGYKGMDSEARNGGLDRCFAHYIKTGDFTDKQKIDFLPVIRKYYELDCKRRGTKAVPFPPSLQAQRMRLIQKRKKKGNATRP